MDKEIFCYIIVMATVTYAIRFLPLAFIRQEIKNPRIRAFFYYMPYVTLAVMTFPAILSATSNAVSSWGGLIIAVALAYSGGGLFRVSIGACLTVFVIEMFL